MAEAEGSSKNEFVCPKCTRSFSTKQGLSMHITRTHVKPAIAKQGRTDSKGTADLVSGADRVVWKKNGPVTTEKLGPGDRSVNPPAQVSSAFQRPLDESKLSEHLVRMGRAAGYVETTLKYLDALAAEIAYRREVGFNDDELVTAFFLLYMDAQASA